VRQTLHTFGFIFFHSAYPPVALFALFALTSDPNVLIVPSHSPAVVAFSVCFTLLTCRQQNRRCGSRGGGQRVAAEEKWGRQLDALHRTNGAVSWRWVGVPLMVVTEEEWVWLCVSIVGRRIPFPLNWHRPSVQNKYSDYAPVVRVVRFSRFFRLCIWLAERRIIPFRLTFASSLPITSQPR
jgi:hypothetical protein